jgi:hypothetical protein
MEPNLITKDEDNKEALLAIRDFKHILILSEANHLQPNQSLHGRYLFGAVNAHLIRHSFTICIFEKPYLIFFLTFGGTNTQQMGCCKKNPPALDSVSAVKESYTNFASLGMTSVSVSDSNTKPWRTSVSFRTYIKDGNTRSPCKNFSNFQSCME